MEHAGVLASRRGRRESEGAHIHDTVQRNTTRSAIQALAAEHFALPLQSPSRSGKPMSHKLLTGPGEAR